MRATLCSSMNEIKYVVNQVSCFFSCVIFCRTSNVSLRSLVNVWSRSNLSSCFPTSFGGLTSLLLNTCASVDERHLPMTGGSRILPSAGLIPRVSFPLISKGVVVKRTATQRSRVLASSFDSLSVVLGWSLLNLAHSYVFQRSFSFGPSNFLNI